MYCTIMKMVNIGGMVLCLRVALYTQKVSDLNDFTKIQEYNIFEVITVILQCNEITAYLFVL